MFITLFMMLMMFIMLTPSKGTNKRRRGESRSGEQPRFLASYQEWGTTRQSRSSVGVSSIARHAQSPLRSVRAWHTRQAIPCFHPFGCVARPIPAMGVMKKLTLILVGVISMPLLIQKKPAPTVAVRGRRYNRPLDLFRLSFAKRVMEWDRS